MPQIKIPERLKIFFKKEGIDDLPRILEFLTQVSPVIIINNQSYPVLVSPGGKLVDNYTIGGAAFNVDTQHHRFIVPPGKRWLFFFGIAHPDVSGTVLVYLRNPDDKLLGTLGSFTAGTTQNKYPEPNVANQINENDCPFVMEAGWYIETVWGDVQTTAAKISCIILEIDIE